MPASTASRVRDRRGRGGSRSVALVRGGTVGGGARVTMRASIRRSRPFLEISLASSACEFAFPGRRRVLSKPSTSGSMTGTFSRRVAGAVGTGDCGAGAGRPRAAGAEDCGAGAARAGAGGTEARGAGGRVGGNRRASTGSASTTVGRCRSGIGSARTTGTSSAVRPRLTLSATASQRRQNFHLERAALEVDSAFTLGRFWMYSSSALAWLSDR